MSNENDSSIQIVNAFSQSIKSIEDSLKKITERIHKYETGQVLNKVKIDDTEKDLNGLGRKVSGIQKDVIRIDKENMTYKEFEKRISTHKQENCGKHEEAVRIIKEQVAKIPGFIIKASVAIVVILTFAIGLIGYIAGN